MTLTLGPHQVTEPERTEALIREARRLQRRRWRRGAALVTLAVRRGGPGRDVAPGRWSGPAASDLSCPRPFRTTKGERPLAWSRHFVPVDRPDRRRCRPGWGHLLHRWEPGARSRPGHATTPGRGRNGGGGFLRRRWPGSAGHAFEPERRRRRSERRRLLRRQQSRPQGLGGRWRHLDRGRRRPHRPRRR